MLGVSVETGYSSNLGQLQTGMIELIMTPYRQRLFLSKLVVLSALALQGPLLTSACTPIGAVASAGVAAGTLSAQERGFKTGVKDAVILAKIRQNWLKNNFSLFANITATVIEGRVLLTGTVPKSNNRIDAVRLAWQVKGVKEVLNEIEITDKSDLINVTRDAWITAQLKVKLTVDGKIKAINYAIDAVNGVVYLVGIAQDSGELDRVISHTRNLNYVRRIVNYVRIKNSQ